MKGKGLLFRLKCALAGINAAYRHEKSFRTQILAAVFAVGTTFFLHPPAPWLALVIVMTALVLAAELFNTALEHLLDGLHREQAEFVRIAKDCSAAGVLVLAFAAAIVYVLMLESVLRLP